MSCNTCNGGNRNTGKIIDFRHRSNNHKVVCRYGTSTDLFDNLAFECDCKIEHVAKEPCFKGKPAYMKVNNENKLLFYDSSLSKMRYGAIQCQVFLFIAAVLVKMSCTWQTLYHQKHFKTQLVWILNIFWHIIHIKIVSFR